MMREEFESLTGIFPSGLLYHEIEKEYMSWSGSDKQDFCRLYKANADGIAEKCARRADLAFFQDIETHRKEIDEAEKRADAWRVRYEQAVAKLDRELGWTSYEYVDRFSDKDYQRLEAQTDTTHPTDAQVKGMIARDFSFNQDLINLRREIPALEINKYHQIRKTGRMIRRDPLYNSSDWNYAAFEVCGYCYEMVNGELRRV